MSLFIAECKYGEGGEEYIEAIDQLFKYLMWKEGFMAAGRSARSHKISSVYPTI